MRKYQGINQISKDVFRNNQEKVLDIEIGENHQAKLLYYSKTEEEVTINVVLKKDAILDFDFVLLNQNSRIELNVDIVGEGANLEVGCLSLAKESNKYFNVNVIHNAPNSNSVVSNAGISFKEGHHNFNINGTIKEKMAGSNARQLTKGLILDETGSCKALPILYIDNYDVKAYHGASIGKISDEDLFYLMSRGLKKLEAFMLVINGLLEPFIKKIDDDELKSEIISQYLTYFGEIKDE